MCQMAEDPSHTGLPFTADAAVSTPIIEPIRLSTAAAVTTPAGKSNMKFAADHEQQQQRLVAIQREIESRFDAHSALVAEDARDLFCACQALSKAYWRRLLDWVCLRAKSDESSSPERIALFVFVAQLSQHLHGQQPKTIGSAWYSILASRFLSFLDATIPLEESCVGACMVTRMTVVVEKWRAYWPSNGRQLFVAHPLDVALLRLRCHAHARPAFEAPPSADLLRFESPLFPSWSPPAASFPFLMSSVTFPPFHVPAPTGFDFTQYQQQTAAPSSQSSYTAFPSRAQVHAERTMPLIEDRAEPSRVRVDDHFSFTRGAAAAAGSAGAAAATSSPSYAASTTSSSSSGSSSSTCSDSSFSPSPPLASFSISAVAESDRELRRQQQSSRSRKRKEHGSSNRQQQQQRQQQQEQQDLADNIPDPAEIATLRHNTDWIRQTQGRPTSEMAAILGFPDRAARLPWATYNGPLTVGAQMQIYLDLSGTEMHYQRPHKLRRTVLQRQLESDLAIATHQFHAHRASASSSSSSSGAL